MDTLRVLDDLVACPLGEGDDDEVTTLERTLAACAWLVSIAEAMPETAEVASWLNRLGAGVYERLQSAKH